jgi:hypothetical protein
MKVRACSTPYHVLRVAGCRHLTQVGYAIIRAVAANMIDYFWPNTVG